MMYLLLDKKELKRVEGKEGSRVNLLDVAKLRRKMEDEGHETKPILLLPEEKELEKWVMKGEARTPDGCRVEPLGSCEHGYPSWLIILGHRTAR